MNAEPTQIKFTIGAKIRNRRLQLGYSQQELLASRYSEAYLSRVERDQLQPSKDFLAFLAARLGVSVPELMTEVLVARPKVRKFARENVELELSNARGAIENSQPEAAKVILSKFEVEQLPTDLLGRYYTVLGQAEMGLKDYEAARLDLQRALKMFEAEAKIPELEIEQVRYWLGLTYYYQAKYWLAIEQHQQCLRAIRQGRINDAHFNLQVHCKLAGENLSIGNSSQALELYQQAVGLLQASNSENIVGLATIYQGIGRVYLKLKDLTQSKLYLKQSADLYEQAEQLKAASLVKAELGMALLEQAEFEEAEILFKAALALTTRAGESSLSGYNYIHLALLNYKQGNLAQAEDNAKAGVTLAKSTGELLLLGEAQAQLAEIKIGQNRFEEGIDLFEEALTNLQQANSNQHLNEVFFRYAGALEKGDKLPEAIQMYRKAYQYKS